MGVALASTTVGREREIDAIERFLAGARQGFRALLLEGEPGIGKTTVFGEALRMADSSGMSVLSCRPTESEAPLSFAAIGDLLHAVPRKPWSSLPAPQRRALRVALLEADPGARPVDRRAVAAGVRSLLTRLAAERPLLLAVDDVQWLDTASAAALEYAIRRLGPERIGVLTTRRLGAPARLELALGVPPAAFSSQRIGPLGLGALQHLLRERFGDAFARSLLVRIHGTSGGNPLFALEIARVLAERGAPAFGDPLPVPDDVRALVRERVEALPDATRDLLLAAALLTHPTVETLGRVLGRAPDADLATAERAGIAALEGSLVAFAHPLHAAAVVAAAMGVERRRMHRRLAEGVDALEERALHLALGADRPDERHAALLEEGAAAACARGSLQAAAELLERARALTPASEMEAARARGIRAAELHMHAGDRTRSCALLQELLTGPLASGQRAEALRLLAELLLDEEDPEASERLLLEALASADDPTTSARIQVHLAFVVTLRKDFARAADYCHQALASLEGSDDAALLAEALARCAMADYNAGRGIDWTKVDRALALEDPGRMAPAEIAPSGLAAHLLASVGRHAEARRLFAAQRARLAERGDEAELAWALLLLSWLETRSGNFGAAAEVADEAIDCASLTANRALKRLAVAQRAWVDAHLGDLDPARQRCAEAAAPHGRGDLQVQMWITSTLALAAVSVGDYEDAWRASRALTEVIEPHGVVQASALMYLPDALEALVGLGELDRAEAVLGALEAAARAGDPGWALATSGRCRGLLLAARGDPAGAVAMLDAALLEHARFELPFERARILLVKGLVERRRRRPAEARRALGAALAEFDRLGARLWAARARQELGQLGERRRLPLGELTPSERRVADLAVEGLSNKEIAAALFVSVHTIEVHLSRAYGKLGVHSRMQLARTLAGIASP